jgi:hypothetical protein
VVRAWRKRDRVEEGDAVVEEVRWIAHELLPELRRATTLDQVVGGWVERRLTGPRRIDDIWALDLDDVMADLEGTLSSGVSPLRSPRRPDHRPHRARCCRPRE